MLVGVLHCGHVSAATVMGAATLHSHGMKAVLLMPEPA